MARPLPRPRHTPRCKCVVCVRQSRAQNPFALGAAVAGAIGGAVGGALTGALRNPPKTGRKLPPVGAVIDIPFTGTGTVVRHHTGNLGTWAVVKTAYEDNYFVGPNDSWTLVRRRSSNPSLALVGLGLPNPAGRRGRRPLRAKNPALALVGLGLPNPPRHQNPTNHACAKDRGYRGEISLEEARQRARETGKLAEFEKSVKYYRATHGKAPTSVAVYAYDDGSRQKRVSFGVVFGKSDQIFYEDTPDGKKRNRDGSNKKWVHETSRKAPPSLVWFADTGLLGYVGGALHVNSSGRDAGWLLD